MEGKSKPGCVFVFGAGGHAKVVIDIIDLDPFEQKILVFDDASENRDKAVLGYSVEGGRESLLKERKAVDAGIVAIGSNKARLLVASWLREQGFLLCSFIHPSAQIGCDVTIKSGTVVMAGVVVNPSVIIGNNCIINTSASIDHDCYLAEGVHIAPGATLCGGVIVGEGTLIGAGVTILPGVSVGKNMLIRAGTVVKSDIN